MQRRMEEYRTRKKIEKAEPRSEGSGDVRRRKEITWKCLVPHLSAGWTCKWLGAGAQYRYISPACPVIDDRGI